MGSRVLGLDVAELAVDNLSSPYIKKQDNPHGLPCKSKGRASEDAPPVVHIIFFLADAEFFHQLDTVFLVL